MSVVLKLCSADSMEFLGSMVTSKIYIDNKYIIIIYYIIYLLSMEIYKNKMLLVALVNLNMLYKSRHAHSIFFHKTNYLSIDKYT